MAGWTLGDWIIARWGVGETIDYPRYMAEKGFPQEDGTPAGVNAAKVYWTHLQTTLRDYYRGTDSTFPAHAVPGVVFKEGSGPVGVEFVPVKGGA